MEYVPSIILWLRRISCCNFTVWSSSSMLCCSYCRCSLCLALWLLMLPTAVCTFSSLSTDPFSSAHSCKCLPLRRSPQLLQSVATVSQPVGLMLPASLWRMGLALGLETVWSRPIQHFLGGLAILHSWYFYWALFLALVSAMSDISEGSLFYLFSAATLAVIASTSGFTSGIAWVVNALCCWPVHNVNTVVAPSDKNAVQ